MSLGHLDVGVAIKLHLLIANALRDQAAPVVTEYSLFLLALPIINSRSYKGESLERPPAKWDVTELRTLIRRLIKSNFLVPDPDFHSHVWVVVESASSSSTEEVCCLVDPFCYISHISAMQRHGLTDRNPTQVHISRPSQKTWSTFRETKVKQDLGNYARIFPWPRLHRVSIAPSVRGRPVRIFETVSPGAGIAIRGGFARIATAGRTFVDTIDQPSLCGGMRHVLDVWRQHASDHLNEIIQAVDATPRKILKVRAGYILEEVIGIKDSKVEKWAKAAQRGSSVKLDPHGPFEPRFSEKWMISINV